jgi:hypothetical protein
MPVKKHAVKAKYAYGICGVFCEMCPNGNGKIADTAAELHALVKGDYDWAEGTLEFKIADMEKGLEWLSKMRCPTCLKIAEPWCEVLKCEKARELGSCLLCDDFMTCKNTDYHRDRYPFVIGYHKRVKEVGLEKHLAEERERTRKGADLHKMRKY